MTGTILFVDDDALVICAMQRVFNNETFKAFFASNASEALTILADNHIDIIITDLTMPGMNGYELLQSIKDLYQNTIRVIISGHIEDKDVIKNIMDGTIKLYIQKPWDNETIRLIIHSLLAVKDRFEKLELLDILSHIQNLPSIPVLCYQIDAQLKKGFNLTALVRLIGKEPNYTVKILQVANSSSFHLKTGSLRRAINFLGINNIKYIILAAKLFENSSASKKPPYATKDLWLHSVVCNDILGQLYRLIYLDTISDEFSTIGILHDLGKLVIQQYFPEQLPQIRTAYTRDNERSLSEIEKEIIGYTHAEIGAYLLTWWNFPADLVDICLFHHFPLENKINRKDVLVLLYLADLLTNHYVHDIELTKNIDEAILDYLHISKKKLMKIVAEIKLPKLP